MTDRMHIGAGERGLVRVFAVDLPPEDARAFVKASEDPFGWPLPDALGAEGLDPEWVDLVIPRELGTMSLSEFLIEGPGVSEAALSGDRARLDALTAPVLVLPSRAFGGQAQQLSPEPPLRWIGTYAEDRADPPGPPLRSPAAEGQVSFKGGPATPGPGLRGASLVVAGLIVLGLVLLALPILESRP